MNTTEGGIFISYRRSEEAWAGRLFDSLKAHLPGVVIFRDVKLDPGVDFKASIMEALSSCKVLIALISPTWIDIRDENGDRRLDNPTDLVRVELSVALMRNIRMIPVLLAGAKIPPPEQLPEEISLLSSRQAFELSDHRWDHDCRKLASAMRPIVQPWRKTILSLTTAVVLAGITTGLLGYWMGERKPTSVIANNQVAPNGAIANEAKSNEAVLIKGRLLGLNVKWGLTSNSPELYLRREYQDKDYADFYWLIFGKQKFAPETLITFYIDDPTHEPSRKYDIAIVEDFYKHEVILRYDAKIQKLGIQHGKDFTPLQERDALYGENTPAAGRFRFNLIPVANAQVPGDLKTMSDRLESNDPIVRIQARSDLAAMGRNALPYIQEVLTDSTSSYRLQLGVLVALNNLKAVGASLAPLANCAIIKAANNLDTTLKDQAEKYLSTHRHLPLSHCKEKRPPYVPPFPGTLLNARYVYITGEDFQYDQEAMSAVEDAVKRWGKFQVVHSPSMADMIFVVHCYPSEDLLEVRGQGSPTMYLWRMTARNGLAKNETPLVAYLREAFEKASNPQKRNSVSESPSPR